MLKHFDITKRRVKQFTAKLRARLYTDKAPVKLAVYSAPDRISYADAMKGDYRPAQVGEKLNPPWSTHWFRVDIAIPDAWHGREIHLLWDTVSEGQIYIDGQPVQALTGLDWSGRPLRGEFRLPNPAPAQLYIEVAVNHLFGFNEMGNIQETSFIGLLRQAEIACFDRAAWDLLWDYTIIAEMAQAMPQDSVRGRQALFTANEMVNAIGLDDRATWTAARAIAAKFLAMRNGDSQHNLSAIGHAHLDTAWLWPLAETRRKAVRTITNTLGLMQDYPEYKFAFSQAAQHEWIKTMQPELYAKMKQRIAEGRIVPVGGMWIEPDTNVPSGESLIRQFVYGQRYFQQEYGITCKEIWIPDVFGYCAQLPQIAKLGRMTRFLTQKLSWNQINKPQHHTFQWEGLDGTQMLTHFPPADTYNANTSVEEALYNVRNFKDLERANESYMLFGFGDGGGGPTMEMLERIARMRDLDGLPRFAIRSSDEFFARCEADAKDLNVVSGELYFELHRGTYTTQARTKKNNRLSELLLHDIELLAAVAPALGAKDYAYPREELDRLWKLVLLNQFHDILPGSSIHAVYDDSWAQFDDVLASGGQLRAAAVAAVDGALPSAPAASGQRVLAINTTGFDRAEVVELPAGVRDSAQIGANGAPLGVVTTGPTGIVVESAGAINARGAALTPVSATQAGDTVTLENEAVRAVFKTDGALVSLYHKATRREALAADARANQFVMFDDDPNDWEAWDVDVFHLEKRVNVAGATATRVVEHGPLRAAIEFTYQLSARSTLRQIVSLDAASAQLAFATDVDWHEDKKFLKVEFPLAVRSPEATYDVQFGHLRRPTHFNTSYDVARFEVCAHKWGDLSETGFGVALLNDCKYGYATHGNVMRLSLLRSPKSPDQTADMGAHSFRYALLPHAGAAVENGVIEAAYAFNMPLLVRATSAAPHATSLFAVDSANAVIETVKKAEDSSALIVRLYEARGGRGPVTLTSSLPVKRAWLCDGLEGNDVPVRWDNGASLTLTPFQIVTIKLEC